MMRVSACIIPFREARSVTPLRTTGPMKMRSYYCLCILSPPDLYESTISACIELGMLGCEEKEMPEGVELKAYFKSEESARKADSELKKRNSARETDINIIEDRDWNAAWRETMKPARLAAGWHVSPAWLPPPESAKQWIKIEPKTAFGTGHHETTRLAAQAIIARKHAIVGGRVFDIGTGSGVLCFVANRCGARSCFGIEIDAGCRGNLAENRNANTSSGKTRFIIGSIDCLKERRLFDLVVVNMLFAESAPLLGAAGMLLGPCGLFVWSGILIDEHREAVQRAQSSGLSLLSAKKENEWWCGTFITDG
jgi:ribosomal protein L11 methyltransferase